MLCLLLLHLERLLLDGTIVEDLTSHVNYLLGEHLDLVFLLIYLFLGLFEKTAQLRHSILLVDLWRVLNVTRPCAETQSRERLLVIERMRRARNDEASLTVTTERLRQDSRQL